MGVPRRPHRNRRAASRRLIRDPRVADLYPEYLVTLHFVIRASVPLMGAAHERAVELMEGDPVSALLAPYFEEHIPEERDHDEWLLEDLEVLGKDRLSILARPPSPAVAAAVGAQYYWILHYHPVALLGHIGVLEGYPPTIEMLDDLVERTGHSRAAFRTLRSRTRSSTLGTATNSTPCSTVCRLRRSSRP